jgi:pimeloyl-ACP methyl ester carboxylesterase
VCLLDALGIRQAAVVGGSAGAPSALQMAIRHPDRITALVLLVPLTYKPPTLTDSAPPMSAWVESAMMRLIGSDFLFWAAIHVVRDQVIKVVLATPPELLMTSSVQSRRGSACRYCRRQAPGADIAGIGAIGEQPANTAR